MAVALLLAAVGLPRCATEPRPERYDLALREVRLHFAAPSGAGYRMAVEQTVRSDLSRAERACRPLKVPDDRSTVLLYRLGADGTVLESIVYPSTAYARCMHERIVRWDLPPPPRADYWIAFEVDPRAGPLGGDGLS